MIYWVLHKKLTQGDWNNWIEGCPAFFFEHIKNFIFLDISSFSWFAKIENIILGKTEADTFDYKKLEDSVKFIKSKKDFLKLDIDTEKDIFIFQSYNNPRISLFNQLLKKYNCRCLLLNHWQLPMIGKIPPKKNRNWLYNKFIKLDKKILFLRVVYRIFYFISSSDVYFDFILSCGTKVLSSLPKNCTYNAVIPCHSVPYNEFLMQSKEKQFSHSEPYFVFIDQAMTIHPDNKGFSCFTEAYRKELMKSLDYISQNNGNIRIIVAEHPRVRYPASFWGRYEHLSGKTASLIMGSDGVIGHFSTSAALAFLAKKRTILLESSSSYFPFNSSIDLLFDTIGGAVLDMNTLSLIKEKNASEINLKDTFSLIPDDKRTNDEIFSKAFETAEKSLFKK